MTKSSPRRRPRRARRLLAITSVIVIAGLAVWFFFLRGGEEEAGYRTAAVTRGDIESSISALGSVQPKFYVDVGAQVSGQLDNLEAEVGDKVEKGQLLAEIDPTLLESRVSSSEAQLRQLRASYQEQLAQLDLARSESARSRSLFDANAISRQEMESSDASLKVAEAQLTQLSAQIDGIESTLNGDRANLDYTRIYAPMDGTVVSITALEGQTLNANQTAPTILRIADLSVMTIEADVSEADVTRVRPGMDAYFHTLGEPDRRWEASVRQVLPQPEIVNDVVLYKALMDVANTDGALLPDMSAQVFFLLGEAHDALTIPAVALRAPGMAAAGVAKDGSKASKARRGGAQAAPGDSAKPGKAADPDSKTVMIMTPDGPQPRQVKVGLVTRTEAEIISGLSEGDDVVVGMAAPAGDERGGRRFGR